MRKRKRKVTIFELLITMIIIAGVLTFVISYFKEASVRAREEKTSLSPETKVSVMFVEATLRPTAVARLVYEIPDQWGYDSIKLFDYDFDGQLDGGECSLGEGDPRILSANSDLHNEEKVWEIWCGRFAKARKRAIAGLNDHSQKQKEN